MDLNLIRTAVMHRQQRGVFPVDHNVVAIESAVALNVDGAIASAHDLRLSARRLPTAQHGDGGIGQSVIPQIGAAAVPQTRDRRPAVGRAHDRNGGTALVAAVVMERGICFDRN